MLEELISYFDSPKLFIAILLILVLLLFLRNTYNVYKKGFYKRENNELKEQLLKNKVALKEHQKQAINIENLQKELTLKQQRIVSLEKELKHKEHDISTLGQEISHQKQAFEKYIDYKNVEANNTRLGAHFVKNVINQIYIDLEIAQSKYKSFLGVHYKIGKSSSGIPPIKALKNIFKLLDYNVSALHQTEIAITEEIEYIEMFLDLIRYLKPNANIKLENYLNDEQKNSIQIKPTLFFPFIENALKHGNLNNEDSFVSITLNQHEQNVLKYCLVNSTEKLSLEEIQEPSEINGNFGLNALQQLIHTYYPGSSLKHSTIPNNQYMSELTLALP
ncbi:hypothetical protein [uncultured Kordia sp.]|uniref:hypothetical protein n=1 Tax=uncultured Kordia sp. TaxID=507699 RepID=UPI002635586A|nr:hypothetical protein [uncultured Kordia sp.]